MVDMQPNEFRLPAVLRVGVGTHRLIHDEVSRLGARRVLFVSDRNCARIPEVAALVDTLRSRVDALELFLDIPGEPTTADVEACLATIKSPLPLGEGQGEGSLVIGIGGGAVLDTAKAVAALATNGGRIVDYMGRDRFTRPRLPLLLAPTTAGTGSEATRYTVITDAATDVKMLITDWKLLPDVAVVDPLLVVGSPPKVTASSGVDALTHAIEAYVSQRRQPTADLFALGAIRQLYPYLLPAFRDGEDLESRTQTLLGALHAGIAFCNSSVALVHGMSRPIGAHFHVAHGLSNSMLLPTITAWSLPATPERYRDVAHAMGLPSEADLPDALARLAADLEIPRLGQVVDPARVRAAAPQMARDALASGSPQNNPRVPTEAEIVELYDQCL
jgi:alcohol dehydrogenase class IV